MNEENKVNYYAIIPATVRYDKNLKPAEKLLYGEITALSNKNGYCYAQNRYFANLYGVSVGSVSRWLSHLQELGYINIKIDRNENKEIIARYIYIIDISCKKQYPIDNFVNTPYTQKNQYPIDNFVNTPYTQKCQYPIDKNVNTLPTKKSIPIDEKVKENNINNNNTSNNKIDDLFYYITNRDTKISKNFYKVLEHLEFNYTEEMLFVLNKENLQMIKNIIYVLYELHNSKYSFILSKVNRESFFKLYKTSKEHRPKNFLNYYKKAIINKYNDTS